MDKSHNKFLVQIGCKYVGSDLGMPCQGQSPDTHLLGKGEASFEVRYYQNLFRALDLIKQDIPQERINDQLWDEACREQDTIGVRCHKSALLCDDCTYHLLVRWGGAPAAHLALMSMPVTRRMTLGLADRKTEQTALLHELPGDLEDKDILQTIRERPTLDLRYLFQ